MHYGPDADRTILVSGTLSVDESAAALLPWPPGVRIAAASPHAAVLRPTLELLGLETGSDDPGAETMRSQLTHSAFKRVTGRSPSRYRSGARRGQPLT
jgi:hypothetical protein